MARREGTFSFSYSKKNWDIKELIDEKKSTNSNFVTTDYFCEAARFYEQYKDRIGGLDEDRIKSLIDERVKALAHVTVVPENTVEVDKKKYELTTDIDGISEEWIDED